MPGKSNCRCASARRPAGHATSNPVQRTNALDNTICFQAKRFYVAPQPAEEAKPNGAAAAAAQVAASGPAPRHPSVSPPMPTGYLGFAANGRLPGAIDFHTVGCSAACMLRPQGRVPGPTTQDADATRTSAFPVKPDLLHVCCCRRSRHALSLLRASMGPCTAHTRSGHLWFDSLHAFWAPPPRPNRCRPMWRLPWAPLPTTPTTWPPCSPST